MLGFCVRSPLLTDIMSNKKEWISRLNLRIEYWGELARGCLEIRW